MKLAGEVLTECLVTTPTGDVWRVQGDVVTDNSTGSPVNGYVGRNVVPNSCGVDITSAVASDIGDWMCSMTRQNGATLMVGAVANLRSAGQTPNDRAPRNSIPSHYDIWVIEELQPNFMQHGRIGIDASVVTGDPNDGAFSLKVEVMTIDEASVSIMENGNSDLPVNGHVYDFERELHHIMYNAPAKSSFDVRVEANYSGPILTNSKEGIFAFDYPDRDSGGSIRYVAATDFETNDARKAYPCIDEPEFKATYQIRIGRNSTLNSWSNTFKQRTGDPVDGFPGFVWDEYERTPVMSTYLVAWAVGEYQRYVSSEPGSRVTWGTLARPDAIADGLANFTGYWGPRFVDEYERIFNVPYGLDKMDQIASRFDEGGAMENPGLITYGETSLLINLDNSAAYDESSVAATNAHELAHQWTGDLVTCKWWDSIWLNEGYANYLEYLPQDGAATHLKAGYRFYIGDRVVAMRYDNDVDSHPILREVPSDYNADFGTITYNKGANMNKLLESILGFDTFMHGLTYYFNEMKGKAAETSDLFTHLTIVGRNEGAIGPSDDIAYIMMDWLIQKNYPVINVTVDRTDRLAIVKQERFLQSRPDTSGDNHTYQWRIPLTYSEAIPGVSTFDTKSHVLFDYSVDSEITVGLGNQNAPVIFNNKAIGYYRVNYDKDNWDDIIDFLNNDPDFTTIPDENRAQLLDDAYSLAEAGYMSYDRISRLVGYLDRESLDAYVPLSVAIDILEFVEADTGNSDQYFPVLKATLEAEIVNRYNAIKMVYEATDEFIVLMTKQEIVRAACLTLKDPDCSNDALTEFQKLVNAADPIHGNPINRNLRYAIYCAAIRDGPQSNYDFLNALYDDIYEPHERLHIRSGLSCSSSKKLVMYNMDKLLDPLDSAGFELFEGVVKYNDRNLAVEWMKANGEALIKAKGKRFYLRCADLLKSFK